MSSTGIPTPQWSTLPGKPAKFAELTPGNTLNAATANTTALNAAGLEVSTAGGGTVWVADGLWRILLSLAATFVRAYPNVTIRGQSRQSILEVYSGSGNYLAVFYDAGQTLTNFSLRSLTIRQNPTGNTSADIKTQSQGAPDNNQCQFGLYVVGANCRNIKVIDTNWEDCCGVNTLDINSTGGAKIRIRDNDLSFKRGPTTGTMPGGGPFNGHAGYDASMITVNARDVKGSGNVLRVDDYADFNGGVEIHGVEQDWQGNQFHGVYTAFSIVPPPIAADNQTSGGVAFSNINVSNNQINRAAVGIAMQLPSVSPNQVNAGGWTLHKNKMTIWQGTGHHDSTESAGIWLQDNGLTASVLDGLKVTKNEIEFEPDTRATSTRYGAALHTTQHGIILSMRAALRNPTVTGNSVIRAPATGMQFGYNDALAELTGLTATDNETIDAGFNPNNALVNTNNQRAHIDCTGLWNSSKVFKNRLRDTKPGAALNGLYGIRITIPAAPLFSYVGDNPQQTSVLPLIPYVVSFGPSLLRVFFGDIANGATLNHQQLPVIHLAPTGNRTGTLLTAGTSHMQPVTIVNDSNFTVTFAATGTYGDAAASNVAGGTGETIPAQQCRTYRWFVSTNRWYAQR